MISHRKRPILYVDDTIEQRYAMRRILETEGFAVLEAGSGREALALLSSDPALAIVDVRLPDMNGYDLSKLIKENHPHLPLLQVSASFSDPDLRAAGFSGGADAYIAQPIHPAEFTALVRRMLRTSEAEESLRFLASIGPLLTLTLSLPEASESIRNAMVPQFADRCALYLNGVSPQIGTFWPDDASLEGKLRAEMEAQSTTRSAKMMHSRLIIAPLSMGNRGFGSIALELNQDREYTSTDCILAADLANRIGLTLQNCLLFASEQATRSALIQAEKLATAGRMAAAIAHEINNPLEALTNLIYILEQSSEATPAIRETASAALTEVTRLAHITRQTLGFYHELRSPTILNLSQSVSDTLELYKKRFEDRQIRIKLDLAESVYVLGIKGEIRQVISNLLVNALEATATGGQVHIRTFARGKHAVLSVKDDGPGIPEEHLSRIFEPFFTTKQGTGTGLGLWITQSIVEKHEGKVKVTTRSDAGTHGTKFDVEFPRAAGQ